MPTNLVGATRSRVYAGIRRVLFFSTLALGTIVLAAAIGLLLYADDIMNGFVKDRVRQQLAAAFPGSAVHIGSMRYAILKNRLDVDSLALTTSDSGFSCTARTFSLRGVAWWKMLWEGGYSVAASKDAIADAQGAAVVFRPSQYEFRCDAMQYSIPDSTLRLDSCSYTSLLAEEQFFSRSRFRQTRFRAVIPHVTISRFSLPASLTGHTHKAARIGITGVFTEILVNGQALRQEIDASTDAERTVRVASRYDFGGQRAHHRRASALFRAHRRSRAPGIDQLQ